MQSASEENLATGRILPLGSGTWSPLPAELVAMGLRTWGDAPWCPKGCRTGAAGRAPFPAVWASSWGARRHSWKRKRGNQVKPRLGFPSPAHTLLRLLAQVSDVGSFCWLWSQPRHFFFPLLKLQTQNELKLPLPRTAQKNLKDVRTCCTHESPALSTL